MLTRRKLRPLKMPTYLTAFNVSRRYGLEVHSLTLTIIHRCPSKYPGGSSNFRDHVSLFQHPNSHILVIFTLSRTMVSGINYPKSAAAMCVIWIASRVPYTMGYASGDPDKVRFQGYLTANRILKSWSGTDCCTICQLLPSWVCFFIETQSKNC